MIRMVISEIENRNSEKSIKQKLCSLKSTTKLTSLQLDWSRKKRDSPIMN